MWPFRQKTAPVHDVDERLRNIELRLKTQELESGILRNKVLRKLQIHRSEIVPVKEKKKPIAPTRKLYGGKARSMARMEQYEDDDYDDDDDDDDLEEDD